MNNNTCGRDAPYLQPNLNTYAFCIHCNEEMWMREIKKFFFPHYKIQFATTWKQR